MLQTYHFHRAGVTLSSLRVLLGKSVLVKFLRIALKIQNYENNMKLKIMKNETFYTKNIKHTDYV